MAKIYIGNQEIGGTTKYESVSASSKELQPNVFYDFGDRGATSGETITLTFANAPTSQANEYMWQVLVDENNLTLTIPSGIKWMSNDNVSISGTTATLTAKYTYQFSVLNGIGLIASVDNGVLDEPTLTLTGNTLSWNAVPNATSYKIESGANSTTQTTRTFDVSTWYPTGPSLSKPTNLTLTSTTDSITASCDVVANATKYTFYYQKSGAFVYTPKESNTNSVTITGLDANSTYWVYVVANGSTTTVSVDVTAQSPKYSDATSSKDYTYSNYGNSPSSEYQSINTQAVS